MAKQIAKNQTLSGKLEELEINLSDDKKTGIIKGYASVYDNLNCFGYYISKGAYASVLKDNHSAPKMFFNHDSMGVPVGRWTALKEDKKGLYVEGELTLGVSAAKDIYEALKAGTIDGLSVGIRIGDYEEDDAGNWKVLSIERLYEISICSFPADGKARISETLSQDLLDESIDKIQTVRDFEACLRDFCGFSKKQALTLVSRMKKAVGQEQRDAELAETLKKALGIAERIENQLSRKN